jgi:hypothetical protein
MAAFVKFNQFIADLGLGVHNLDTGTLKIALTNTAPTTATDATLSNITQITAANGYSSGGATVANAAYSQTSGTGKLTGDDVVFTASGGSIGAFRYAVLYNDTPTSPADPLIGYWDYGASITITDGNTFTVDFSASNGLLQIA